MAVIRDDEISRSGSVDAQGFRTYTRTFQIETDNPEDGPIVVSAAIPIATWASHYSTPTESDPYALCKTITVQPEPGQHRLWTYTVTYDTRPFDQGAISNPLAGGSPPGWSASPSTPTAPTPPAGTAPAVRPWVLKFGSDHTTFAPVEDVLGNPIAASNNQRYTGITIDSAIPYFSLSIPRATVNFSKPATYTNSINSDVFMGYNVGTVRCVNYEITSQYEAEWGYFWQVDLKFQINNDGWDLKVIDEGNYWTEDGDLNKPIDKWSNPVDTPVWLNGAGGKNTTGIPVFNSFQVYRLRTFANIL